jgi:hypothetical protein
MKEILLINPGKRKKTAGKKRPAKKAKAKKTGVKTMATAKRKKRTSPKKRTTAAAPRRTTRTKRTTRRRRRRNPSIRAIGGRTASMFTAKALTGYAVDAAKQFGGQLACQFAAKKFAEGGGSLEVWGWKNYMFGLIGTFVSGIGADMIKRGSGAEFIKGGMALMMYKAFTQKLANKSNFVQTYFGEESMAPEYKQYLGYDGNYYSPGDSYLGEDGEVYLMGADGVWRPTTENYRDPALLGYEQIGESIIPAGSLGESLSPVGPLGEDPYLESMLGADNRDPYAAVFLN